MHLRLVAANTTCHDSPKEIKMRVSTKLPALNWLSPVVIQPKQGSDGINPSKKMEILEDYRELSNYGRPR